MIVPLVSESEWLCFLRDLPPLEPPSSPVVVLSPHPDDETLAAGGLIFTLQARGVDVLIVAVTDGENAYENDPEMGKTRVAEQISALEKLGVCEEKIIRLRLPDRDVTSQTSALISMLAPLVTEKTHLVAPWHGDFHPDHEACGRAAEVVAAKTGATLTSYFFWTWHRGTPALLQDLKLHSFSLDNQTLSRKVEALRSYHSQLEHPSGKPILPKRLLEPALRPFEVFILA